MKKSLLIILILIAGYSYSQTYEIIEIKGKTGVKNIEGKIILPAKYSFIYECRNSETHLLAESKKFSYILLNIESGEQIILDKYSDDLDLDDKCNLSEENTIRFYENNKVGLLQFPQKILVPAGYDFIYPFDYFPGKCLLQNGEKYCIWEINEKKGSDWFEISKEDYGFNFDNQRSYIGEEDFFTAKFNGKWHLGNMKGKFIPIEKYVEKEFFIDEYELFLTKREGKYGYINYMGEEIIPCMYEDAEWFNDYTTIAKLNGKYGIITLDNDTYLPFVYDKIVLNKDQSLNATINNKTVKIDEMGYPMEAYISEEIDGKYGFIDPKGKILISHQYDYVYEFIDVYALVNIGGTYEPEEESVKGGKWGYILPTGDFAIECKFDDAEEFNENIALVTLDGNSFYIDRYGKCVKDCPE